MPVHALASVATINVPILTCVAGTRRLEAAATGRFPAAGRLLWIYSPTAFK